MIMTMMMPLSMTAISTSFPTTMKLAQREIGITVSLCAKERWMKWLLQGNTHPLMNWCCMLTNSLLFWNVVESLVKLQKKRNRLRNPQKSPNRNLPQRLMLLQKQSPTRTLPKRRRHPQHNLPKIVTLLHCCLSPLKKLWWSRIQCMISWWTSAQSLLQSLHRDLPMP